MQKNRRELISGFSALVMASAAGAPAAAAITSKQEKQLEAYKKALDQETARWADALILSKTPQAQPFIIHDYIIYSRNDKGEKKLRKPKDQMETAAHLIKVQGNPELYLALANQVAPVDANLQRNFIDLHRQVTAYMNPNAKAEDTKSAPQALPIPEKYILPKEYFSEAYGRIAEIFSAIDKPKWMLEDVIQARMSVILIDLIADNYAKESAEYKSFLLAFNRNRPENKKYKDLIEVRNWLSDTVENIITFKAPKYKRSSPAADEHNLPSPAP